MQITCYIIIPVKYDDLQFGEELCNGQFASAYQVILNDKTVAVKN